MKLIIMTFKYYRLSSFNFQIQFLYIHFINLKKVQEIRINYNYIYFQIRIFNNN
jgi:hypothetical protein